MAVLNYFLLVWIHRVLLAQNNKKEENNRHDQATGAVVIRVLVKALKNNNAFMVVACVRPVFACTSIPCVWFKKRRQEKKGDLLGQGDWHIQFAKLDAAPLRNPAGVMSNDAAYGNN